MPKLVRPMPPPPPQANGEAAAEGATTEGGEDDDENALSLSALEEKLKQLAGKVGHFVGEGKLGENPRICNCVLFGCCFGLRCV